MAETWNGSSELESQTDESNYIEKIHLEPLYDSFICPLTKQIMRDPVTLENGQTFEREAIEKWFKKCKSGRKMVCPVTRKELRSNDLNPSIALRNTIEEWIARNEAVQLDMARKSLNLGSAENDIMYYLKYVQDVCQKTQANKYVVRDAGLIPMIIDLLKSISQNVRCRTLETLRIVVEGDDENKVIPGLPIMLCNFSFGPETMERTILKRQHLKEVLAEGDTVRTIVKFLSRDFSKEKEEAVSLLFELSKSRVLSEKICSIAGAILILSGMTNSQSENLIIAEKADRTLENLEKCENYVQELAQNGRLQPLLTQILEGPPEIKVSMVAYLGEQVLNNEQKIFVAKAVGSSLISIIRSKNMQSREAALKALNQISSFEASAKVLIDKGILPPLVKGLFTVGSKQLPMRLKEVSATILANVISSGNDFDSIPVGPDPRTTLVSEDIILNLLHLISNTGPAIERELLQVLVGLTNSPSTVLNVVSAIKSSGATITLIQFIEAPQPDLRVASLKLLKNISPHMSEELAESFRVAVGQLSSLFKIISENTVITEEQAAAVGVLADLPRMDLTITMRMLDEGTLGLVYSRVVGIRQGETRGGRYVTPFLEALVRILARVTFFLADEPSTLAFCCDYNLTGLFIELLQSNGIDDVQMTSAIALEALSLESKKLTKLPELPPSGFCGTIFNCFRPQPNLAGLCRIHGGTCSLKESFCLLEGKAVEKLVALLDHANVKVVEAALAAISTLLVDGVNIEQGVVVLCDADGVQPILDILLEKRSETLRSRAVWTVERLLRTEDIAYQISENQIVNTALVDAFHHGDYRTRQIAERALRHVDRLPNFSDIFPKIG